MRVEDGPTRLRRLQPGDAEAFVAYRNDPDIARFQSWNAMDRPEAVRFLTFMHDVEPLMRPGEWIQIAVADAKTDELFGDMGWHLSEDRQEVELGITLAKSHHGQGHATRAMRLAIGHVLAITQALRIVAFADLRNHPSRAVLRRAGFFSLGTQVHDGTQEEAFEFLRPV